ncbi:ATPase, E1-E2 type [Trichormus variabilis ATCC 29413]|uniref:ATPase, E1-E2 type n=2 Tax=Anabaena variabilis TaxID=264691 RepID=Q3MBW3_TRIV2|nr:MULTISPECIES: cation-translocating P-type ATPase [Nostocaceae]ABA21523.1 ATPase, E1-E2 type [Trichormus variabilis ATCC 29413]MBC1213882.1 cation-translocating P-type ATPase [Trichormus variabilis ARAD]MBC1255495.1 cation-translocating P-type ATPase [Trichormus variabilis V5]MBC1266018.1 cation-translocating P-type ATPase [Trichormus variabilis FSR]MBC1302032.1 cation-translocating P-type ATPase [Trichormus variabilis N2B]
MSNWYQLDVAEVLHRLGSEASWGLSTPEASHRLEKYGFNELIEPGLKQSWQILWEQLSETLVIILIAAAVISALLGDYKDGLGIIAIILLITFLGFSQEYRAQKAIANLKQLSAPNVKVRRDGRVQEISARRLVPGDIVLIEAEDIVPADCRLLSISGLRTQEAALTGAAEPVDKNIQRLTNSEVMLGDRHNMVYMQTIVTYGRGEAVVTETGMQTELGHITNMIQTVEPELTPLQKRLDVLGRWLAIASFALVGIILALGLLRGEEIKLMFLTAITLVVAALPEGLPAVVSIALALGAQQMLKRRALIRNLPAVETLGSVTTICSGKTGTLTENRMVVTVLDVAGRRLDLAAHMRWASPVVDPSQASPFLLSQPPALALLLAGATLCNNARLEPDWEEPRYFRAVGDPIENALVMAAAHQGLWKGELEQTMPRVGELLSDFERQRMTTIHQLPTALAEISCALETVWHWHREIGETAPYIAFTKGRIKSLLDVSSQVWVDGCAEELNEVRREQILTAYHQLTQNGLRVLGLSFRLWQSLDIAEIEQDLIFIGLVGMNDPARPEVRDAVLLCKQAGIRPVMITGDHPLTAQYIAQEVGIATGDFILTSNDLSHLSPEALGNLVEEVSVYARISPEHKFNIVQFLQRRRHIVAMTGDGANDAPALKKADIGIAMGINGTDVAREAADMVLLDDNFATIVAAVKEGRIIYDNIRKFIKYILSSNVGELCVMLLAPFLGMPLPLLPLQILWINITTDGLPALALGVEPAERDTMNRPPHPPHENIFGRGMGRDIIWIGLLMSFVSLVTGYLYWRSSNPGWQTILFTTVTLSQMGNALAIRSERDSLWQIGLLSNKPILAAVILTLVLQLAVIYLPVLQNIFATVALSPLDLGVSLILSTLVFWGVELKKWLMRRRHF